ncbi:restriction endonuclease [Candidatus Magnetobacterium bavaricum]|uniref:Restriction endonuclease n=1 Tax=Candidatus Magnetobacterium bavaricum TaxID=29290 RepID=A0A0F3GMF6_9BACT|nr:restriction endonuclease [Candidatus Magnetobacterium bavaricum]
MNKRLNSSLTKRRLNLTNLLIVVIHYTKDIPGRCKMEAFEVIEEPLTEIIDGEEIMSYSPFRRHEDIFMRLSYIIQQHIKKDKLGYIYGAPLDVILEEGINRLQPDLIFVKRENSKILQDWIRGVPDMVCEIVSKGSVTKDTAIKKDIYERYRVPEYWIVLPETQTVQVFIIEDNRYRLYCYAEGEGVIRSKAIDGLEMVRVLVVE